MRATSEASLAAASERFEPVLTEAGENARGYGEQLFAVVDALDSSGSLRRALTDPTRTEQDKADLARRLLSPSFSPEVVDLVVGMVRSRWSGDRDLADSLEELATVAVLASTGSEQGLLEVEEQLFRVGRVLTGNRDLRVSLGSLDASAERRITLAREVFAAQLAPQAQLLLERTVGALRTRSVTGRLSHIGDLAATRRRRLVAVVTAAMPLTLMQRHRLATSLERVYGAPVQLNVGLDPEVLGGLRIQVGAEVLDATVLSKLSEARRRIAG